MTCKSDQNEDTHVLPYSFLVSSLGVTTEPLGVRKRLTDCPSTIPLQPPPPAVQCRSRLKLSECPQRRFHSSEVAPNRRFTSALCAPWKLEPYWEYIQDLISTVPHLKTTTSGPR